MVSVDVKQHLKKKKKKKKRKKTKKKKKRKKRKKKRKESRSGGVEPRPLTSHYRWAKPIECL